MLNIRLVPLGIILLQKISWIVVKEENDMWLLGKGSGSWWSLCRYVLIYKVEGECYQLSYLGSLDLLGDFLDSLGV